MNSLMYCNRSVEPLANSEDPSTSIDSSSFNSNTTRRMRGIDTFDELPCPTVKLLMAGRISKLKTNIQLAV